MDTFVIDSDRSAAFLAARSCTLSAALESPVNGGSRSSHRPELSMGQVLYSSPCHLDINCQGEHRLGIKPK